MNREFPTWLASTRAILEQVLLDEDTDHWGRPARSDRQLVFGWYRDREYVVLHWSAETPVGPRDHYPDAGKRLRSIAKRFQDAHGFVTDAHASTGDTCGTMMLSFLPVIVS